MNRLAALLIVSLVLTSCERQINMTWPGVYIKGHTATFDLVSWSAEDYKGTPTPGFSFRTPDGGLLTPDSMTIEIMDAHGATEEFYGRGTSRRIEYGNGWMSAYFDGDGRLEMITVVLSTILFKEDPRRTIHIGNRESTRWVSFPARREELVELFGEPEKEGSYVLRD